MLGTEFIRPDLMRHAQDFLEGGAGGGLAALLTGLVFRKT